MQQLKGAAILALAVALSACTEAANDGASPDGNITSAKSSLPASLDREPPAFAAYVPPPQIAAALAAWREATACSGYRHMFSYEMSRALWDLTNEPQSSVVMNGRSGESARFIGVTLTLMK
jgi:hypothetical protein